MKLMKNFNEYSAFFLYSSVVNKNKQITKSITILPSYNNQPVITSVVKESDNLLFSSC